MVDTEIEHENVHTLALQEGDYGYCRIIKGRHKGLKGWYDDDAYNERDRYIAFVMLEDGGEVEVPHAYCQKLPDKPDKPTH